MEDVRKKRVSVCLFLFFSFTKLLETIRMKESAYEKEEVYFGEKKVGGMEMHFW